MIEEYKRLRQRDGTGAAKSAWRITVRQLESMIRLSEGMARMHCQDEVNTRFWSDNCFIHQRSNSMIINDNLFIFIIDLCKKMFVIFG